ncbi:L-aspartate oxidase [Psychromicrobium xiongbiense]|uniref:L-aspartate oxidase n=1 Tax=Psychromicrobium xiongbiense TaxID=3051184 RepID=UPI00255350EA|nr:L-aspartate oxidase [Psychromicrobium sp. YIM S02556]
MTAAGLPRGLQRPRRAARRIAVVGSGLAGLTTALTLRHSSPESQVVLFTKDALGESNSRYAQGGLAAVLSPERRAPGDSVESHAHDTLVAGAWHSDRAAVAVVCASAAEMVDWLVEQGVRFDRDASSGHGSSEHWSLGLEAAHSYRRILHAGGDLTGQGLIRALTETTVLESRRSDGRLEVRENATLLGLLTDSGAVRGLRWADSVSQPHTDSQVHTETFDAVVLATGGGGQLYSRTTNPAGATADGLAAAWNAGAVVQDLEFFQFHPTLVDHPQPFMVSEAVRGEGAVLRNERGERFMLAVHPDAELAPRDVVSRGIAAELAHDRRVYLDARGIAAERGEAALTSRFPGITVALAERGYRLAQDLIPVQPGAHYWMGGVSTDLAGQTSLPGLFAVGEVACTGVHGANRLASNSLLEAAVFAGRAAAALRMPEMAEPQVFGTVQELRLEQGEQSWQRADLQTLMSENAGVIRTGEGLALAAKQLTQWRASTGNDPQQTPDDALLRAGQLLVTAAQARTESLGAHWRADAMGPALPQPTIPQPTVPRRWRAARQEAA